MLPQEHLGTLPEAYAYARKLRASTQSRILSAEVKPLVFIAGPYSNPYPVYNTRRAMAWSHVLAESSMIVPFCPHLTMFQDLLFPRPYRDWLELDKQMLRRSDAVLRIDGRSSGADGETSLAAERGLPVFHEEEFKDLFSWSADWLNDKS